MPAPSDFTRTLAQLASKVEVRLAAQLDACAGRGADRLLAAMRHAVLNGGKRFRPFLVIETAALFGVTSEAALEAATAIEYVHCYSLVHDDLPSMDDDDLRRGQPTVHVAFDEATAVLAGDALQTMAFEVLASDRNHDDPAVRADLLLELATASGLMGMAGGQMLDLEAEAAQAKDIDVQRVQSMKTGALIKAAVAMGAILGHARQAERDALTIYSENLGLAFQISDDILDVTGDAATVGKATGKDSGANKATFVSQLGLDGARAKLHQTENEALAALEQFGNRAGTLRNAMAFMSSRKS